MSYTLDNNDPIRDSLDASRVTHQILRNLLQKVARHFAAECHITFLTVAFDAV